MKTKLIIFSFLMGIMTFMVSCRVVNTSYSAYTEAKTLCIGTNGDGGYVLRVTARGKNRQQAYDAVGEKAVKAVIFEYITFSPAQNKPLDPILFDMNAKTKYEDYFAVFFAKGGEYINYFSMRDKKELSNLYTDTKEFVSCTATVTVDRIGLKRKLQADGVFKSVNQ